MLRHVEMKEGKRDQRQRGERDREIEREKERDERYVREREILLITSPSCGRMRSGCHVEVRD